jgi:O-antigen ligase
MIAGLFRGRVYPGISWPLILFFIIALISAALAFFQPILPYKNLTLFSREIRAFITLIMGLCYYLIASSISSTQDHVKSSLRALYIGLFVALAWSTVQTYLVLDRIEKIPWQFNEVHRLISIRDLLKDRVTGMAYEPSWLGDQLVLLYLPFLLSNVLTGTSVFTRRKGILSVELILSIWTIFILLMTKSRISFISFGLMIAVIFALLLGRLSRWLSHRTTGSTSPEGQSRSKVIPVFVYGLGIILSLGAVVGAAWALSKVDRRMERLFQIPEKYASIQIEFPYQAEYEVANQLAFAERIAYWEFGFNVFEESPILGVGLGNTGFLFEEHLAPYAHTLVEMKDVLDYDNPNFPNPKNLWVRLLAETGIIGFALFSTWVVLMLAAGILLATYPESFYRMMGIAGILAFTAFVIEGFSLDSFALPQMWIVFGLLTASWWISERHSSNAKTDSR